MDEDVQRRSGGLSKLNQIFRRQRREPELPFDEPDLDFTYGDTDTDETEIAELYSYSEEEDFQKNHLCFVKERKGQAVSDGDDSWKECYVQSLLDRLELTDESRRVQAARSLLYLMQGMFFHCTTFEEQQRMSRHFSFIVYKNGGYPQLVQLLICEANDMDAAGNAITKASITIADNENLRLCLGLLYHLLEGMRQEPRDMTDSEHELRDDFIKDLGQPVCQSESLAAILFDLVLKFCSGSMPHYPIKKLLLLLWKTILLCLGGFEQLCKMKENAREAVGLPPTRTWINHVHRKGSLRFYSNELVNDSEDARNSEDFDDDTSTYSSDITSDLESESDSSGSETSTVIGSMSDVDDEQMSEMKLGGNNSPPPLGGDRRSGGERRLRLESGTFEELRRSKPRRELPGLPPKVRRKDINSYIELTRSKFVGLELGDDHSTLAGLPNPIHEGVAVLQSHVYTSLADVQVKEEDVFNRKPSTVKMQERPNNPTEDLYRALLPSLPQYMIALLKILLAAAPTAKAKSESLNILVDVLGEEAPSSVLQSMQQGIDVNRHKEIIMKSITAILLLLLKHFKLNHVYQFEFMSQHLVFANCIPLVLKLFNQNVPIFIAAKNSIPALGFPKCLLCPSPELTEEGLETGDDKEVCWRNMFSSINLLRVLQKLVKWKHSRTMMLVVFKSAPILKRALKVRHHLIQLYILKLLKVQAKYLGRNWRKSNMRTMSAIYQRVRHRLCDDWAFGNDLEARPWDFQAEECALRACVEQFNSRHYSNASPPVGLTFVDLLTGDIFDDELYQPSNFNVVSVLSEEIPLSDEFKKNYEEWLEDEIFSREVDWDAVLQQE